MAGLKTNDNGDDIGSSNNNNNNDYDDALRVIVLCFFLLPSFANIFVDFYFIN